MATSLTDLQKTYSDNNLGQFKTYQGGDGSNYLYIPGAGNAQGGYFNVDQGSLSQLDQAALLNGGPSMIQGPGGINTAAFSDPIKGKIVNGAISDGVDHISNYYTQAISQLDQAKQKQATDNLNAAIKSGDVATVEQLSPGSTLWNGAFVNKSQVPGFQASGSTVQGGNVVGPKVQDIPGVGTLTTTPKNQTYADVSNTTGYYKVATPNVGPDGKPIYDVYDAQHNHIDLPTFQRLGLNITQIPEQNIGGLMDRQGVAGSPPLTSGGTSGGGASGGSGSGSGGGTPNLPTYGGSTTTANPYQSVIDSFNASIKGITDTLVSSQLPSETENNLKTQLADLQNKLKDFDAESLQRQQGFTGQGRGETQSFVSLNQTQDARTRALQRLGLSNDVSNISNLLTNATDNRTAQSDAAKEEYTIATKQTDYALGAIDSMQKLSDSEQTKARQYLLDLVNFSAGKTFDQLDPATQAQITVSTANSPITLGMVKTALENGSKPKAGNTEVVEANGRKLLIDSQTGKTISDLGAATTASSTDIFGDAKKIIQQYKNNSISRADIEKQYSDAGKTIPPEVTKALDDIYGTTAKTGFSLFSPSTWFQ